jgi:hypothetical protein
MLQEDIEDETDVALRDSRMSAASSLREMSMSLTSRPSAMGNNPILAYSAGTQSVASTAGFSVGAGTGTGAGAGAGELAMTDRNSGAGEGFGVARTSSSVGQASTPQPSTTFPKAIRPTVLQPAAAISVPTGQRDRANDGAAAKPELSQPQTASYSPLRRPRGGTRWLRPRPKARRSPPPPIPCCRSSSRLRTTSSTTACRPAEALAAVTAARTRRPAGPWIFAV